MPRHTTKNRTTKNLKRKNNQNCQKIELYASLTTRELKKKHSFRPVGGAEMGSQAERIQGGVAAGRLSEGAAGGLERDKWQMADWAVPHLHVDKPGGISGWRDRPQNPGFQQREIKPQNL